MSRSVLLLRAVNVGGHGRVPMARLRVVLEPLLGVVTTYIASGNIVCEHPSDPGSACAEVRALIASEFDVDTPVIPRTHEQLVTALDAHPFDGAEEKMLHAMFLEGPAAPRAVEELTRRLRPGERIALVGTELWIDYGDGVQGTKLTTPVFDRTLGVVGTARNLRTVRRLAELTT